MSLYLILGDFYLKFRKKLLTKSQKLLSLVLSGKLFFPKKLEKAKMADYPALWLVSANGSGQRMLSDAKVQRNIILSEMDIFHFCEKGYLFLNR